MADKSKTHVPFQLPKSGKFVWVPKNKTEEEVYEWVFKKLKDKPELKEDRKAIGDNLDTEGNWSLAGGLAGALAGAGAGALFGGFGAIPGAIIGGITGGAGGEAIDQYRTGKGDTWDIVKAGALGGLGGLPTGGAVKGASLLTKAGLKAAGKHAAGGAAIGGTGGAITGGEEGIVPGAALGAASGGLLGPRSGGLIGKISKHLGLDKEIDTFLGAVEKPAADYANGVFQTITGRVTAGQMTKAQAQLEIKRNMIRFLNSQWKKVKGSAPSAKQTKQIDNAADAYAQELADKIDYKKVSREAFNTEQIAKPRVRVKDVNGKTFLINDETGAVYEAGTNRLREDLVGKFNKGGKLSDKIGLLRREGYPQDQAVAIAHSYKRRGLLK